MIGVIANPAEHEVVREFFELFKTPWEFFHPERKYEVLLCAGEDPADVNAKLVIVYSGGKTHFDEHRKRPCTLTFEGGRIPVYGNTVTFPANGSGILKDEHSQECVGYLAPSEDGVVARIGYDLFLEVRTLLTEGQPCANAHLPALELHIAFLRNLITRCGIPLVEIPPSPDGHPFIVCLTHDVDHPSIRAHKWDHTMFGFLFRAVFGSLFDFLRGRVSARSVLTNWTATLKLPFVHLGLAEDFWARFDERYLELEEGLASTFFMIPFKDEPGRSIDGPAPAFRAARYGARDIADRLRKLAAAGCEVGLHGIDAWIDSSKGREEVEEVREAAGATDIGVRMHWLYYSSDSPATLEKTGAIYDSTIGYNETVGYRAGTTQVYKPVQASRLLELPLHVMDTALFYPNHLGLSERQANALLEPMMVNAVQFGGTLTINWHDRSLAPERLWGACYRDLLKDLKAQGAWFATAGRAVAWFRKRRSATFEVDPTELNGVRVQVPRSGGRNLPRLRLRIHKPQQRGEMGVGCARNYVDVAIDETPQTRVPAEARG